MRPPRPELLALITARAGSKRLPGKNLLPLGGLSLLGWTCRTARAVRAVTRVVLSTEAPELADEGARHGAEVPFRRPEALASDEASSMDVVRHALEALGAEGYAPEYLLLLQPTSPFRAPADVDAAFERLRATPGSGAVIAVTEAKPPQWTEALAPDGRVAELDLAPRPLAPGERWVVPSGAFYLARVDYLLRHQGFAGPGTLGHLTDPLRALDIDTPADLELARRLLDAGLVAAPGAGGEPA